MVFFLRIIQIIFYGMSFFNWICNITSYLDYIYVYHNINSMSKMDSYLGMSKINLYPVYKTIVFKLGIIRIIWYIIFLLHRTHDNPKLYWLKLGPTGVTNIKFQCILLLNYFHNFFILCYFVVVKSLNYITLPK